jgi:hypothetical protein
MADELSVTGVVLEQTARVAMRAQRNELLRTYYAGEGLLPLDVTVTTMQAARLSSYPAGINEQTKLGLRRDYDRTFNRNAILLIHSGHTIARVPRPIAHTTAFYMESGTTYAASMTRVNELDQNGQPLRLLTSIDEA